VAIIGTFEELPVAATAVDMIFSGSEHSSVYKFLESKRRELKRSKWDL
jgi:rRNA processing protein Krr1/Pno1